MTSEPSDPNDPEVGESSGAEVAIPRLEPDTIEREVFAARLEARMLGVQPELPRIDRFAIERKLGAGGMGTVWLARDEKLDRRVALKLVRGSNERASQRMRIREARGLARIAHPNVIAIHDVGEHEGRVWLAMEYVPGQTLHACASELERETLLRHWIAAGRGLAAIHAAGLVHRDVKPDNVLLGFDGRVRVIDLGLVRPADERGAKPVLTPMPGAAKPESVMTPGFVGTRNYAAPEQLRGGPIDARTDQFGFCKAAAETLRAATKAEDGPLPAFVRRALARGQEPDPEQRFADMDALLDALESGLGPQPTPLAPGQEVDPAGQHQRLGTMLLLASLALLLGLSLVERSDRGPPGSQAKASAVEGTGASAEPSPGWAACMARAKPPCGSSEVVEVVEFVVRCEDTECDALEIRPEAARISGERLPFDVDVDNRTPAPLELRWHTAAGLERAGEARHGPGRRPLAPHWQAAEVPVCVDFVDANGRLVSRAITTAAACGS